MAHVYFEFSVQGAYVRVAAIDAMSGLEVSIVGALGTSQLELQRLALKKLDYVRNKNTAVEANRNGPGKLA